MLFVGILSGCMSDPCNEYSREFDLLTPSQKAQCRSINIQRQQQYLRDHERNLAAQEQNRFRNDYDYLIARQNELQRQYDQARTKKNRREEQRLQHELSMLRERHQRMVIDQERNRTAEKQRIDHIERSRQQQIESDRQLAIKLQMEEVENHTRQQAELAKSKKETRSYDNRKNDFPDVEHKKNDMNHVNNDMLSNNTNKVNNSALPNDTHINDQKNYQINNAVDIKKKNDIAKQIEDDRKLAEKLQAEEYEKSNDMK
jgi:hypothetical protein